MVCTRPVETVAFPPMENMNLHLNVVVNDLAVAIFMATERRITVIDGLVEEDKKQSGSGGGGGGSGGNSGSGGSKKLNASITSRTSAAAGRGGGDSADGAEMHRSNVGAVLNLSFGSNDDGIDDLLPGPGENNNQSGGSGSSVEDGEILKTHSADDHHYSTTANTTSGSNSISSESANAASSLSNSYKVSRGLKHFAASAVKALNKGNMPQMLDAELSLPPIEHELQTPLDIPNLQGEEVTSKDVRYICKRNAARREKYTADLALLAGSVMDAYDRYTRAAETLKDVHDPLWYAAALEGIATSFVAMSDTGGHGADIYLERNFQYPAKVMEAALAITGVKTNEIYDSATRVDKNKTTMSEAVTALLQEACDIMSRNIKLSSIYSELLLKMAWYIGELEGIHLLCKWGEGFSGGEGQDDAYGVAMTAAISGQQKRWEMTSVSKIDLQSLRESGKLDALLSKNAILQCQRFTETLHRTASNGGLDAYTRAGVGARCAQLCLKGVKVPLWCNDQVLVQSSFRRMHFPRKAAYFSVLAAESMTQCKVADAPKCAAGFWAAASHLYSKEGNKFDGNSSYAWACLRATVLHAMTLHGGPISSEVGKTFCFYFYCTLFGSFFL